MAVTDVLHLHDIDTVIIGRLPFLNKHLCPKTEKKIISLILVLLYFAHFLKQLLRQVNFTDECCPSATRLYQRTINLVTEEKQKGHERRNSEEKKDIRLERRSVNRAAASLSLTQSCLAFPVTD